MRRPRRETVEFVLPEPAATLDSYFPFWGLMLERFDLALFDLRNCGRNPFHAAEPHDYARFARDNPAVHGAIAKEWGGKTTIGVFHSMSAIAALLAVVDGIWRWDALVLFDPPLVPPEGNPLRGPLMAEGEVLRLDPASGEWLLRCRVPANRLSVTP